MLRRTLALCGLLCASTAFAQSADPVFFSVPGVDAPELAARGPHAVGVRTIQLVHKDQVDILKFDKATGKAPLADRPLPVEAWYPATIPPGQVERTTYTSAMPGRLPAGMPKTFSIAGKALRDAPPSNGTWPLVIISHGYPGSRLFLTYLGENLASKGYIAVAIDHTDSVFGEVRGFPSTLLNRSNDQLFTIDEFTRMASDKANFLAGKIDTKNVAIIGYSMGGYGALASAGAGYSQNGTASKLVPGGYFDALTLTGSAFSARHHDNLKAIVAIAPWGAQPPHNNWDDAGFAAIKIPSLFIVGDQDDISEYRPGVKKAFDHAINSQRCMLVYQNARHNVGGNPPPPEAHADFTTLESFDEPVWRKDRIAAINQHFVTAFLDLYLKGDQSKRSYLNVPTKKSNDGVWPLPPGQNVGAAYSKGPDAQPGVTYWKGFQRRFAVGLEMYCYAAGQSAE